MILFFRKNATTVYSVGAAQPLQSVDIQKLIWLFGNAEAVNTPTLDGRFIGPRKDMNPGWFQVTGTPRFAHSVQTSVREANDRGFDALVLSDATGSYFPEFQRVALEMIKAQGGIFGWVSDSARVIAALR